MSNVPQPIWLRQRWCAIGSSCLSFADISPDAECDGLIRYRLKRLLPKCLTRNPKE